MASILPWWNSNWNTTTHANAQNDDELEDTLDQDSNDGFEDDDPYNTGGSSHGLMDGRGHDGVGYQNAQQYHAQAPPPQPYYPGLATCIVCLVKPAYSKNGKAYPTCGLRCAAALEQVRGMSDGTGASPSSPSHRRGGGRSNHYQSTSNNGGGYNAGPSTVNSVFAPQPLVHQAAPPQLQPAPPPPPPPPIRQKCVVCKKRPCPNDRYLTCGLKCAEDLTKGKADSKMCDYCHRRPKHSTHNQCGDNCKKAARLACLLCKSRPKHKRYHLCGKTCKTISTKATPLILEVPKGHITFEMVEKKLKGSWSGAPVIKRIFKIIESDQFLQPYNRYKKSVGNEIFTYHGTGRACQLGSGSTTVCASSACVLCSILKTSFKVSLANPSGCFGAGIYSSSDANKAFGYNKGSGVLLLTKVVTGKPYPVGGSSGNSSARSCPAGYNSVIYDNWVNGTRQKSGFNETIVYTDDAIRPVFLLMFS